MRRWLTWVITGALAAVLIAAAGDALRSRSSSSPISETEAATRPSHAQATRTSVTTKSAAVPRCRAEQIGVSIDAPGGDPTIVVSHARGARCHLARLPINLKIWDRARRRVHLVTVGQLSVGGDFSPEFDHLINLTYLPDCDQRGPFLAVVSVGPYVARRTLSANGIGCFPGE
jgi:hypothetical protein